jgi:hypothetical protein
MHVDNNGRACSRKRMKKKKKKKKIHGRRKRAGAGAEAWPLLFFSSLFFFSLNFSDSLSSYGFFKAWLQKKNGGRFVHQIASFKAYTTKQIIFFSICWLILGFPPPYKISRGKVKNSMV